MVDLRTTRQQINDLIDEIEAGGDFARSRLRGTFRSHALQLQQMLRDARDAHRCGFPDVVEQRIEMALRQIDKMMEVE